MFPGAVVGWFLKDSSWRGGVLVLCWGNVGVLLGVLVLCWGVGALLGECWCFGGGTGVLLGVVVLVFCWGCWYFVGEVLVLCSGSAGALLGGVVPPREGEWRNHF